MKQKRRRKKNDARLSVDSHGCGFPGDEERAKVSGEKDGGKCVAKQDSEPPEEIRKSGQHAIERSHSKNCDGNPNDV